MAQPVVDKTNTSARHLVINRFILPPKINTLTYTFHSLAFQGYRPTPICEHLIIRFANESFLLLGFRYFSVTEFDPGSVHGFQES
jgi:hypothetical protein